MVEQPFMVAGTGRWCTRAIKAGAGAFIVKTGAEGVYCGAVPAAGIGIAIKVDDGAARAAECAMGWVLACFAGLDAPRRAEILNLAVSPVNNFAGQRVGEVHPSAELAAYGNGSF
jgi:L-asparaginase II